MVVMWDISSIVEFGSRTAELSNVTLYMKLDADSIENYIYP